MTSSPLVLAADQADALITLRRATHVLAGGILFLLLAQLTVFFGIRYWHFWPPPDGAAAARRNAGEMLEYVVGLFDFAGVILPPVLTLALLLCLGVQIAARLAGAGRTTAAVLWAAGLMLLLFPWQSVLNNPAVDPKAGEAAIGMKIPGVLFTWAEVAHPTLGARFEFKRPAADADLLSERMAYVLHWARYVVFPLAGMAVLGLAVSNGTRGLRRALGGPVPAGPDPLASPPPS